LNFSRRFSYFIFSSKWIFYLANFIFHTIPAFLLDCIGRKAIYSRMYKKIFSVLMMLSYFGTRQWNFRNDNVQRVVKRTKTFKYSDDNAMEFDAKMINWNEYFKNYWPGIQRHLMQQQQRINNIKTSSSEC
jgi:alcohol-forming fatty acyl-CoA reductase